MDSKIKDFKKNIIAWYPIESSDSVLIIDGIEEITNEIKTKTNDILNVDNEYLSQVNKKYDYVVLIGNIDRMNSLNEIVSFINKIKSFLKPKGKILLACKNKFGMKYWAGEQYSEDDRPYDSIEKSDKLYISYLQLMSILKECELKYKLYYPLPDYEITNVIYTDECKPNNETIYARDINISRYNEYLSFSERNAYKEILKENEEMFSFFANSFFVEATIVNDNFQPIKYVSYGNTRKKDYRIKTINFGDYVYKINNCEEAKEHILNIEHNIRTIDNTGLNCLDRYEDGKIISKYLFDAKSYDEVIVDEYKKNGINGAIEKIDYFKNNVLKKIFIEVAPNKDVFDKYGIEVSDSLIKKMHFTKKGLWDLIFSNCLVKNDEIYIYDQEWFEENIPIEFILYRSILYCRELSNNININEIYKKEGIIDFIDVFSQLENKLQDKIVDKEIWNLHYNTVKEIGKVKTIIQEYRKRSAMTNQHVENLEKTTKDLEEICNELQLKEKELRKENQELKKENDSLKNNVDELSLGIIEYKNGIENLTSLIQTKDTQLVNYANEIRTMANSMSWKITKPIRIFSRLFNPWNGLTFIDRIYPPGSQRRAEYDKKITEKRYNKKVENYFKLSDEETAEYWKGIDHRLYLKYEKTLENKKEKKLTDYEKWILENSPSDQELYMQTKTRFKKKPKISIVIPLYNTDTEFFRELLYSIHCQTYKNWELCLADGSNEELEEIKSMVANDKRIKYKFLGKNEGISGNTNSALEMATGEFISLLDHDDMLSIDALYEVVKVINENPNVDFIYSDEDKFGLMDEPYYMPHFKPDYAPDTLRANNYICHYSVFRKTLLDSIGGFNSKYDGAQDFDLILRATEKARKVVHIPKILYHWRVHKGSTSYEAEAKPYAIEAGRLAVEDHIHRVGLQGKVVNGPHPGTYEVIYDVIGEPKVSILIPNKDGIDLLKVCLESVLEKTTYKYYEIIIIENNSENKETFNYYKEITKNPKIKVVYYKEKGFNYSKIINFGVKNSDGDFVVQLNNDTKLITPNWLEKMIGFCQRPDVGACGVKLYYSDNTIQHAGIFVGCLTVAAHIFRGLPKGNLGYFGREDLIQNMNAVTAACIMTRRDIYEKVGYMNEQFAVAFNDIDFCLKIRKNGYLIVYDPFVEFIHYESKTRGNDTDPDKINRFKGEIDLFLNTWKEKLESGDEYYNKNFSLDSDKYDLNIKDKD